MNFYRVEQMPGFIKTEMQKIQKAVQPFMKKTVIYRFLAIPLAAFSLFNLAAFLFHASADRESLISAGIFALLAALGLAFLKRQAISINKSKNGSHLYAEQDQKERNPFRRAEKLLRTTNKGRAFCDAEFC